MTTSKNERKGAVLEEALRAYFLRAGFFVVRGVPFRIADEDLTDVDLWLYERPTGTARRVQVCDIKYKQRPKATERLFWTSGLAEALDVDGAYVATTDKRKSLRPLAERLGIDLIDGVDIQRIQASQALLFQHRISDEELINELKEVDKECRNKDLQNARVDVLSSLSDGFGAPSAVRALEGFKYLSSLVVESHPDSRFAKAAARLAYLAAAIACESFDYVSVSAAFKTLEDRRAVILEAARYGALSGEVGQQTLKLAFGLVERYAPGGRGTAKIVEQNFRQELQEIPAEIIADQASRLLKGDQLFFVGRELEFSCYHDKLPNFDDLTTSTKSMLGALLDYSGIERERFAAAWKSLGGKDPIQNITELVDVNSDPQPNLFKESQ